MSDAWINVTVAVTVNGTTKTFKDQRFKRIPVADELVVVEVNGVKKTAVVDTVLHESFVPPVVHCKPKTD